MPENENSPFLFGAEWMRSDLHLHTKIDKSFKYDGEPSYYVSNYINSLAHAGIRIGVITNHDHFDVNEFLELRKCAKKKNIFLLPGAELTVEDGEGEVHVLVVFSEEWIANDKDAITQLITEHRRSHNNIINMVKAFDTFCRDYFLVFAHVEASKGLWKELNGSRLKNWQGDDYANVRERTLGFQQVRTNDLRVKVKNWFGDWYPAEVEGSDPKSLQTIGTQGRPFYVKIGSFTFEALKFALADYKNRTSGSPVQYSHSRIQSISLEGGILSGQTIHFSPELNSLIGIRGSGKSAIIEVLRYVLDIPFGEKSSDQQYKQDLVGFAMRSGGKATVRAIDRNGSPYEIRRIWRDNSSAVYFNGELLPGVSIRETVLHKPIYFGQKDLSSTGEGFEKDLVEKLMGTKLDDVRRKIAEQKIRVAETIERLSKINSVADQIAEQIDIKHDTEHRLKLYKEHGIEEKLQKRLDFDNDIRHMKKSNAHLREFIRKISGIMAEKEDDLRNVVGYASKYNKPLFEEYFSIFQNILIDLDAIKSIVAKMESDEKECTEKCIELETNKQGMNEEFADIERKLADELKHSSTQNISSDDFLNLNKKLIYTDQLLAELTRENSQKDAVGGLLTQQLRKLNDFWHEEFMLIKSELDKIGSYNNVLSIRSEFKEDTDSFLSFMKNIFKGSKIRTDTYQRVVEKYQDFVAIFNDFDNAKALFGGTQQAFIDMFQNNMKALLTYQTPNKFVIEYHGKALQNHSLGQRASALILFVLSQKENDVIIIDQPEDDLDNQTIYEDVIKLVQQMKSGVQFIFATHNPNIPVLGDAEEVHACQFYDGNSSVQSGSIDDPGMQKTIIEIMEGGDEAFNRRKEIYHIWKP